MWNASEEQLAAIADLHTELIEKYRPACTGAVCDNAKLREFIASKAAPEKAASYKSSIRNVREQMVKTDAENKGMVMKKETLSQGEKDAQKRMVNGIVVGVIVAAAFIGLILLVRRRRKMAE